MTREAHYIRFEDDDGEWRSAIIEDERAAKIFTDGLRDGGFSFDHHGVREIADNDRGFIEE